MNTLFISVHPDDETLGCGGTILKNKYRGDNIYWLIVTGVTELLGYSNSFIEKRKKQIELVSELYGFNQIYELDFPTTKLHTIDFSVLLNKIAFVINSIKPEIIYTVNRSDIHTDHQIVAKAVMSATKRFQKSIY